MTKKFKDIPNEITKGPYFVGLNEGNIDTVIKAYQGVVSTDGYVVLDIMKGPISELRPNLKYSQVYGDLFESITYELKELQKRRKEALGESSRLSTLLKMLRSGKLRELNKDQLYEWVYNNGPKYGIPLSGETILDKPLEHVGKLWYESTDRDDFVSSLEEYIFHRLNSAEYNARYWHKDIREGRLRLVPSQGSDLSVRATNGVRLNVYYPRVKIITPNSTPDKVKIFPENYKPIGSSYDTIISVETPEIIKIFFPEVITEIQKMAEKGRKGPIKLENGELWVSKK